MGTKYDAQNVLGTRSRQRESLCSAETMLIYCVRVIEVKAMGFFFRIYNLGDLCVQHTVGGARAGPAAGAQRLHAPAHAAGGPRAPRPPAARPVRPRAATTGTVSTTLWPLH